MLYDVSSVDVLSQLEQLEQPELVTLPSGRRIWVCPETHLSDLHAVFSDSEVRSSLKESLDAVDACEFVDVDLDTAKVIEPLSSAAKPHRA